MSVKQIGFKEIDGEMYVSLRGLETFIEDLCRITPSLNEMPILKAPLHSLMISLQYSAATGGEYEDEWTEEHSEDVRLLLERMI